MLELPRYIQTQPGEPPVLPRRLLSELHLDRLPIVDIANELALERLELEREDLTRGLGDSEKAEICREITDEVRRRSGVHGLLVPSAALRSGSTLVLFRAAFAAVVVGAQQIVELAIIPADLAPAVEE
jgi:RES domain-containing protein